MQLGWVALHLKLFVCDEDLSDERSDGVDRGWHVELALDRKLSIDQPLPYALADGPDDDRAGVRGNQRLGEVSDNIVEAPDKALIGPEDNHRDRASPTLLRPRHDAAAADADAEAEGHGAMIVAQRRDR